jgi:16S rRNA (guanine(966)-N(2))-methyltransferase RsmD
MRVITGIAKGKRLRTLEGNDVRPTTDRVKEGIFSVLQFRLEGRSFLDLFAGSGQMGIEALSRGAEKAVLVDSSRKALSVINENVQQCNFQDKAKVINANALSFLNMNSEKFDIAFLDPPYRKGLIEEVFPVLCENMKKTGIIICEQPIDEKIVEKCCGFSLDREYRYGKIKVSTFCCKENSDL